MPLAVKRHIPLHSSPANDVTVKCIPVMHITQVSRHNQYYSGHSLNHHSVLKQKTILKIFVTLQDTATDNSLVS